MENNILILEADNAGSTHTNQLNSDVHPAVDTGDTSLRWMARIPALHHPDTTRPFNGEHNSTFNYW